MKLKVRYTPHIIESQAAEDLIKFQRILKRPLKWPLDLEAMIEQLWGIELVYEEKIQAPDGSGDEIVGCFLADERKIIISLEANKHEGRLNFTTAHEAGHVSLHSPLSLGISSGAVKEKIYCRGLKSYQPNTSEWEIEYQANYYASTLLIPQPVLFSMVRPTSTVDLNEKASELMSRFGVSRYALELRLHKLKVKTTHNMYQLT